MLDFLGESGGIVSTGGVAMFIAFVIVLLIFPVDKACDSQNTNCVYTSTAPEPFRSLVQPGYLAASLLVLAAGVFMVRYGRWREANKQKAKD